MHRRWIVAFGLGLASWMLLVAGAMAQDSTTVSQADLEAGKKLYAKRCAHCHGEEGDGQGYAAAYVYPKPRDFTSGVYKFRTRHETEAGNQLATDEDIFRRVKEGLHGTSMPAWENMLTSQDMWQVVHYIKTFAEVFAEDKPGAPINFGSEVAFSPESVAKGKDLFEAAYECNSCHGNAGRGNGQQALDGLEDDWGERIWPANLTKPWIYRGGYGRRDIFRNIALGISGTPMPAFADPDPLVEAREADDPEEKKELEEAARELRENIWHTVNYVQSLWTYDEEPQAKAVLTAKRVSGPLPTSPEAPAWQDVPVNYYPLAGQVIEEPRLFAPMVVGIEVQTLHNGEEIAFRLKWDDRTESKPDESEDIETYVDAVALQFPSQPGGERPYFLMGDSSQSTDLWYWRNDAPDRVVLVQTKGYKTFQPGDEPGDSSAQGLFDNGQYRVVMKRALQTESENERQFAIGEFGPFTVTIWDGSNGENGGGKRTVSAWYNLYLEPEPSKAPMYLLFVGIAVGVMVQFSALYVTKKNHGQDASA